MSGSSVIRALAGFLATVFILNTSLAQAGYTIIERGANHRVWQAVTYEKTPDGQVRPRTHQYTELATGMHYQKNGQWVEAQAKIEAVPGGAVARQGQHQVIFANNLNSYGAIDMQTPDGKRLLSNVQGLMYVDTATGDAVLIARLQDSEGQLIGDNQVLYPNAFEGVNADVRYTYRKSGLEQDVIVRAQLPAPEDCGMSSETTELEVFTEFINPPAATLRNMEVDGAGLEADQEVNWGAVKLGRGKAFSLGRQDTQAPVTKRYLNLQGRYFLLEKVSVKDIAPDLSKLPEQAANPVKLPVMAFKDLTLPKTPLARADASPMRLAALTPPDQGYVLDYVTYNNFTNYYNYTFQGDTTYYLSGDVVFMGSGTFEGGAVLKYASGSQLTLYYPPVWSASAYRPVIFTAQDDNTVGETIAGSTGNPNGYYASCALNFVYPPQTISNFRIAYAQTAIKLNYSSASSVFSNGQLVNCQYGFDLGNTLYVSLAIRNLLFVNGGCSFNSIYYSSVDAQNTTFSGVYSLASSSGYGGVSLKNCILANVPYLGITPSGNNNGFYNSPQFGTGVINNSSNPFQTAGAGSYYLTNGCAFINAGTTNLDATLLASLKQKTTQPPLLFSNILCGTNITLSPQAQRDTDTPDLGYHYQPLDYLTCNFTCNNGSQLTIASGTAIGGGNAVGIGLGAGSSLISVGTPPNPNWFVRYQSVQEQSRQLGGNNVSAGLPFSVTGTPTAVFQFSKFACPAGGGGHLYHAGNAAYGSLVVRHCEFWDGNNTVGGSTNTVTTLVNNLFWRSPLAANNLSPASTLALSNNLVYGTTVSLSKPASVVWYVFNNAFDTCTVSGSNLTNGYNAYLGCAGRLLPLRMQDVSSSTTLGYASSWFGDYYLPANSPLINKGSTTANLAGLYHFTTQTNQAKETNSTVDIGYHYVATDAYGNPLDTDADGVADYLEDSNGNGLYDGGDPWDWQARDADTDGDNLPDWWERYWFGNLSHTGSEQDASGNGYTLWDDYQSYVNGTPLDPNVIQFSIGATNDYVNVTNLSVPVNLTGGTPSYYAVLRDSTNYAAASWRSYTSSNVYVNLGGNQGWHELWVGLKGCATDATVTWQWQRLKLDTVSPALVLTGPTNDNGTVTVPLIQLTGYSAEKLSRISYDLSNAAGDVTNQLTLITGQAYDTNTAEFTTNQFHAYDVPLTEGLNVLTLHATDRAGNVTTLTTNLTCTLPTTPPTVGMGWPLTGWQVSGTNLTLRGQTTDPTATVSVSVVGGDGETNELGGLVGRDGILWVENVPLHAGTNQLWLTVANAMGSTTTNLTLIRSLTNLTINPVNAGQVHIDGSIDTDGYTIWVNGVEATPTNGTWSVDITPIGIGGGLVEVAAIPNSDTVIPGGPGQNPDSAHALHAQITVAAPQGAFVSAYHYHHNETVYYNDARYVQSVEGFADLSTYDETVAWADGASGLSQRKSLYYAGNSLIAGRSDMIYWPASHWPAAFPAATWESIIYGPGGATNITPNQIWVPESVLEHRCDKQTLTDDDGNYGWTSRAADAEVKLATGGPLGSKQMNLWCISATATDMNTGLSIASTNISIGSFGRLDTNGNLWVVLPDNDPDDVTVTVDANNHYTFTVNGQKYKLTILANDYPLADDRVRPLAYYCVGQKINFKALFTPSLTPPITQYAWNYTADYINNHWTDANGCEQYNIAPIPAMSNPTTAWFYNKQTQDAKANLGMYCKFNNGQSVYLVRQGKFNVYRPSIQNFNVFENPGVHINTASNKLVVGDPPDGAGVGYQLNISSIFPGTAGITQIYDDNSYPSSVNTGSKVLDTALFYLKPSNPTIPVYPGQASRNSKSFVDAPSNKLYKNKTTLNIYFMDYVRFCPSIGNSADNIFVTIGKATWNVNGEANYVNNNWQLITSSSVSDPVLASDKNEFPFWIDVFQ